MTDIDELTQQVADHLAGRSVVIKWQNPPTEGAVGQAVKTPTGQLIIYVANLTGLESRFRVLLHELAHCRLDYDFIPRSNDHQAAPASLRRSTQARQAWRADPREERAHQQAAEWLEFAKRNAYKYYTGYQTPVECQLLALLNWR